MIRNSRKFVSNLVLMAGMIAAIWTVLGQGKLRADGPFIIDTWLEEPNLSVSFIWNLYERRDGWYIDNWSEEQLAAVDTFEFGMRETFKLMDMSDLIDTQHGSDAWIKLYNVASNAPDGSNDYPPHINVISYWGDAARQYEGGINGHFYTTPAGYLDTVKTWYAWDSAPNCSEGVRNPGVNVWTQHVDRNCALLWEERVTSAGELEVRRAEGEPVYLLRNKAPSDLDILRDGQPVLNVRRVFYNAWINYPAAYPDGTAKVTWEIRDYATNALTTETIIARPDTGEIVSHERETTTPDSVSIGVQPELKDIAEGSLFDVSIVVQPNGMTVDQVAAYLNFDAAILELVAVTDGSTLTQVDTNTFDNATGHLDYVATHSGGSPPTGEFVLATVTFRALNATAETLLTFNASSPRQTAIFRDNVDYLSVSGQGQVTVLPLAEPALFIPFISNND